MGFCLYAINWEFIILRGPIRKNKIDYEGKLAISIKHKKLVYTHNTLTNFLTIHDSANLYVVCKSSNQPTNIFI